MNFKLFKIHVYAFILIAFCFANANSAFADDKEKGKKKKKTKTTNSNEVKSKTFKISLNSVSEKINALKADEEFYTVNTAITERWYLIMKSVRDAQIPRQDAIDSMYNFTNNLWDFMEKNLKLKKIKKYSDKEWVFPVKGYSPTAIGGFGGSGYISAGFDFFDKNSGGHPAHDIFIDDGNQDSYDDNTVEPVEILSMSGGIVVETRKNWDNTMTDIKGGNIVYVYDNFTNGFFYYAHMKEVYVNVGDFVQPGTSLGIMGRTGKNASQTRSPTHLHIMYVRSQDGNLKPENIYGDLIKAKLIQ